MDRRRPRWGGGRIGNIVSDLKKSTEGFKESTQATMDAFAMFKPFMIDNEYLYRSDNVRALQSVIKEKEKHLLPWYPERLDWYDYWLNVHFPGMRKWVLPTLEEELKSQSKNGRIPTKTCSIFSIRPSNAFRPASRCVSNVMDAKSSTHTKTFAN